MVLVKNQHKVSPNHQTSTTSNMNLPAEVIYNRSSSVSAAAFRSKVPKSYNKRAEDEKRENMFAGEMVS